MEPLPHFAYHPDHSVLAAMGPEGFEPPTGSFEVHPASLHDR